jgi:hypothetical protein
MVSSCLCLYLDTTSAIDSSAVGKSKRILTGDSIGTYVLPYGACPFGSPRSEYVQHKPQRIWISEGEKANAGKFSNS